MSVPTIRVVEARAVERPTPLRLPFRFGDVRVTDAPQAFLEVDVETADGHRARGAAAQLMVPRWFDKRPDLSNEDTVAELRESLQAAVAVVDDAPASGLAALSGTVRSRVTDALTADGMPLLAAGFGPALVECALIDALCRAMGCGFSDGVRGDLFGMTALAPADLGADRLGRHLARLRPAARIAVRHTVGYDAPLTAAERPADAPIDGRPVTLEEVVAETGCRYFKLKLKGDPGADASRLEAISAVLGRLTPGFAASLDANEQYAPDGLRDLLDRLRSDPNLKSMARAVLFVEQPFAREITLTDAGAVAELPVPAIIDESDDHEGAVLTARRLGYAGTSVKSCKGVLRALVNSARTAMWAEEERQRPAILSAEDLTCQPGLGVQQDTLMASLVGAAHVERNGHHFVGGMPSAPADERTRFLAAHPDLYRPSGDDIALRIVEGSLALGSLDCIGFGSAALPDLTVGQSLIQTGAKR
ncbi:MAG: mandelate racemase [Inquilinaceae bacterium]